MNTKQIITTFIVLMITMMCATAFVSVPTITDGIGFQYENITIGDNRIQIYSTNITKEATFVVAASDSLHPYGADFVCDGMADNVQIQAAITAVGACGGGKVVLMDGTFILSSQINLMNNLKLTGCGAATILKFDGSATHGLYGVGVSNVEISHLFIDNVLGMGGSGYRGLIDFKSASSKFSVHDVTVKNTTGTVIGILTDGCQNFRYHNNILDACNRPLRVCNSDYFKIINNNIIDIKQDGLGLCCARHAEVAGNIFDHSTPGIDRGDIWIGEFYRDSYDLNIHHNIMKTTHGIRFIGDGGNGHNLSRVNVENNIITTTGEGISNEEMHYAPSTSVLSDIIIKDNIISGASKGICFTHYPSATMDFTIKDNVFTGCTAAIDIEAGITNDIWRNKGYVTENSGTQTLASGTTVKTITHGLAVTPSAGDIMITPMESLGSASFFWIDGYTATTFNITVNTDPTQDVDIAWKAIVL